MIQDPSQNLRSPKWPQMAGSASTAKPGSVAFRESAKPGKDHLDINIIFRGQDKYKDGWHIQTKTKTQAKKSRKSKQVYGET